MTQKDDIKLKHEIFLYPVVRIFSQKAAGSGTVIYSSEDPTAKGDFQTFVLTNYHVIEDCITHKKEWDSLLKREIEKEFKERPKVEYFEYVNVSTVDSSNRYSADIIAYDRNEDLAILKIDSPKQFPYTARLISEEHIKNLRLFMDVVVSGCSMAHEPFCNFGQLTFLKEIIEQKKYLMTNASSIFGNSGGALFLRGTGELIGVPSRISAIQLGFGMDVITWMGFATHPERIYGFLREQELKFIFDPKDTFERAMERRKRREREALLALKAEIAKESEAQVREEEKEA